MLVSSMGEVAAASAEIYRRSIDLHWLVPCPIRVHGMDYRSLPRPKQSTPYVCCGSLPLLQVSVDALRAYYWRSAE